MPSGDMQNSSASWDRRPHMLTRTAPIIAASSRKIKMQKKHSITGEVSEFSPYLGMAPC